MSEKQYKEFENDSVTPALGAPFFEEHLARYYFARKFAEGKNVLELGCGTGYGARLLADNAHKVLACDMNQKSLDFANKNYSAPNLEFFKMDVTSTFPEKSFDVVISFEVFEHIYPDQVSQYLNTVKKALKPNGKFILSTPNHDVVMKSGMPIPEFHINNLGSGELKKLLSKHFSEVEILGQIPPMNPLKKIIYFADRWNLRHSLLIKSFRKSSRDSLDGSSAIANLPTWKPEQGVGRASDYTFSPQLQVQAGMVLALCSKPRL